MCRFFIPILIILECILTFPSLPISMIWHTEHPTDPYLLFSMNCIFHFLPLGNFLIRTTYLSQLNGFGGEITQKTYPIYTSYEWHYIGFTNLYVALLCIPFLDLSNCVYCLVIVTHLNLNQNLRFYSVNTLVSPFRMNYHLDFVPYHDFKMFISLLLNPLNDFMFLSTFILYDYTFEKRN